MSQSVGKLGPIMFLINHIAEHFAQTKSKVSMTLEKLRSFLFLMKS